MDNQQRKSVYDAPNIGGGRDVMLRNTGMRFMQQTVAFHYEGGYFDFTEADARVAQWVKSLDALGVEIGPHNIDDYVTVWTENYNSGESGGSVVIFVTTRAWLPIGEGNHDVDRG